MAIAFLSTLAVQIGSACFNNFRSKKHAQDLARKQQAYEEKVVREGIENARSEFAELCAFQREMEIEMQKDRLNLIRTNHENSLIQAAYENSLVSWPLMVPPYVIKNDTILSVNLQPEKAIPLNCILTTSSDNKFNKAVFYKLEETIACFCSKYWNVSANKSIRFFQESWRDNFKDIGVKHKDLYAHLSDVPTLVISPVIKNGKLIFRFYWWGLSVDPADAHLNDIANELDPEVNVTIEANHNYSEEEISIILSVCVPKLEAFISFFADMYYWNFYKELPALPKLIKQEIIHLSQSDNRDLGRGYSECIKDSLISAKNVNASSLIEAIKPVCSAELIASIVCESGIQTIDNKQDFAYLGNLFSEVSGLLPLNVSEKLTQIYDHSKLRIHRSYICASLEMLLEDFSSISSIDTEDTIVVEINNEQHIVSIYRMSDHFSNNDKIYFVKYNYKTSALFVPNYLFPQNVHKFSIKGVNIEEYIKSLSFEKLYNKFISELSLESVKYAASNLSSSIESCRIARLSEAPDNFNELERLNLENIYSFNFSDNSNSWNFFIYYDRIDEYLQSLFKESNEIFIK